MFMDEQAAQIDNTVNRLGVTAVRVRVRPPALVAILRRVSSSAGHQAPLRLHRASRPLRHERAGPLLPHGHAHCHACAHRMCVRACVAACQMTRTLTRGGVDSRPVRSHLNAPQHLHARSQHQRPGFQALATRTFPRVYSLEYTEWSIFTGEYSL